MGPPAQGPGLRAAGATACMTRDFAAVQDALPDITGLRDARATATSHARLASAIDRCHLIARDLGGLAILTNLVPCWDSVNTGAIQKFENAVWAKAKSLQPGQAFAFQATPLYNGPASTVPYAIKLGVVGVAGIPPVTIDNVTGGISLGN